MNIEEVSIYESLKQAKDYITHIHFADSNRWAPGFGHLDFSKIVLTLKEMEYQSYVSAEILPLPDQDTTAEMTIKTLNQLMV
jgi:sugar phosphate isomerase/epimerase